jgi:hypothetical protein
MGRTVCAAALATAQITIMKSLNANPYRLLMFLLQWNFSESLRSTAGQQAAAAAA